MKIAFKARKRGLKLNQTKTKYMMIGREEDRDQSRDVILGEFKLNLAENIKCIGVNIIKQNQKESEEENSSGV